MNEMINDVNDTKPEHKYTLIIPYIQDMDDITQSICKKYNVRLIYKPTTKLGLYYSKYKKNIPFELQSDVIYEIPCKDCNMTYRGETCRWIHERMREHQRDIENAKEKNFQK